MNHIRTQKPKNCFCVLYSNNQKTIWINLRCLMWQPPFTLFFLSGIVCRYAECCLSLLSFTCFWCTVLLLLQSPLLWIYITVLSPLKESRFSPWYALYHQYQKLYILHTKSHLCCVLSGLCIMQKLVDCTGSLGDKEMLDEIDD